MGFRNPVYVSVTVRRVRCSGGYGAHRRLFGSPTCRRQFPRVNVSLSPLGTRKRTFCCRPAPAIRSPGLNVQGGRSEPIDAETTNGRSWPKTERQVWGAERQQADVRSNEQAFGIARGSRRRRADFMTAPVDWRGRARSRHSSFGVKPRSITHSRPINTARLGMPVSGGLTSDFPAAPLRLLGLPYQSLR